MVYIDPNHLPRTFYDFDRTFPWICQDVSNCIIKQVYCIDLSAIDTDYSLAVVEIDLHYARHDRQLFPISIIDYDCGSMAETFDF